jgi:5-formyltetrahydrofolate cyclo-ligase
MNSKAFLRRYLLEKRRLLPAFRRKEAQEKLIETLLPKLTSFSRVLSFASKGKEIDLWPINRILVEEKRLLLPRIVGKVHLHPYHVFDLVADLEMNERWHVKEPILNQCKSVSADQIDCIIVPGLGFDTNHNRIGYGKGFYDRFLASLTPPTFGVGFIEQLLTNPIPIENFDIPMKELVLV